MGDFWHDCGPHNRPPRAECQELFTRLAENRARWADVQKQAEKGAEEEEEASDGPEL